MKANSQRSPIFPLSREDDAAVKSLGRSQTEETQPFRQGKSLEFDASKVAAYRQSLVHDGLLREIKPPTSDPNTDVVFQPIAVQGKPLSEVHIEDRR